MDNLEKLHRSIAALADLALRQTDADGYVLYLSQSSTDILVRRLWSGLGAHLSESATPASLNEPSRNSAAFPLRSAERSGTMVFLFSDRPWEGHEPALHKVVQLIESLVQLFDRRQEQLSAAVRIGDLEFELAAEKVTERANGLLRDGSPSTEAIETIDRHAAKVLSSCRFQQLLDDRLGELESRMAERHQTARAKLLLQASQGFSEEQAYLHLRTVSRRTRKRIGDVASEIINRRDSTEIRS